MVIREAGEEDIPEIVEVLKASLGENDLPLSERIWEYKHKSNPFGRSIVFVAEEQGSIVGVRAFMRWKWQRAKKVYSALRAVDTATHPDHQGKGIFKKLTLQTVEYCRNKNENFVFNTPNDKSRPGYLKMGWEKAGKVNVLLRPALNCFWNFGKGISTYSTLQEATEKERQELLQSWNNKSQEEQKFFTPKTSEYLKWRYENNPLQEYEVFSTSNFYLAGHVKIRKNIKELRISECIFSNNTNFKEIDEVLKMWSSKFAVQVISFAPFFLKNRFLEISGNFGPILTVRELSIDPLDFEGVRDIDNWLYSLGDLELF